MNCAALIYLEKEQIRDPHYSHVCTDVYPPQPPKNYEFITNLILLYFGSVTMHHSGPDIISTLL